MNRTAGPDSRTLAQWLQRLESLHPQEIDLGLERVSAVASRLDLLDAFPCVITVAGTNGKGSCVAAMEALLVAQGCPVGAHLSPHLLRYNERIRVDGHEVDDEWICEAFHAVDLARQDISLTYFEFGVLAALWIFRQVASRIILLETGLGGRLDAVNMLDADIAIISSIGLDHQQWLGNDRETIGREKAGIFRTGRPVVCVDTDPPGSVREAARSLQCPWYGTDDAIGWEQQGNRWRWRGRKPDGQALCLDALALPRLALSNVSAALQALALTPYWPGRDVLERVLPDLRLAGRQQWCFDPVRERHVLLDVAHNEQAAQALAGTLRRERWQGRVHGVLAMMADKDHAGFCRALESDIDFWYITQVEQSRCLPATLLQERLEAWGASPVRGPYTHVAAAYEDACLQAAANDLILVCGSFFTVSALMEGAGTRFMLHPER